MVLDRRRILQGAGVAAAASVAGCAAGLLPGGEAKREYRLTVRPVDVSPLEEALYEPDPDDVFGASARAALSAILPEGRYTTYGFRALPEDAHLEHEESYYQVAHVVTGRERLERSLVRLEDVPEGDVPADALGLDDLDRPSARVLEILHVDAMADGESGAARELRGDAYVLRRPGELEGPLASGELDGAVVTMDEGDDMAYRVSRTREPVLETAHTVTAIPVADSREAFREVVFASRMDAELAPADLSSDARSILEEAIEQPRYVELAPVSTGYDALLGKLGLAEVEEAAGNRRLWYDGDYYRYALFVNDSG
jgi:hypothetical protein